MSDTEKWDARYREALEVPSPARVLAANRHLLPGRGKALDLACGLGANALLLAQAGLATHAWDRSPVAITRLREAAAARGLDVEAAVRDVMVDPPTPESFDVIVVVHFLERALCPRLIEALRPRGLLFYQTFTAARVGVAGPRNPAYLLKENELLALFSPLVVLAYREEGVTGDTRLGWRDEALIVARAP